MNKVSDEERVMMKLAGWIELILPPDGDMYNVWMLQEKQVIHLIKWSWLCHKWSLQIGHEDDAATSTNIIDLTQSDLIHDR
jgi:hypothetical protein